MSEAHTKNRIKMESVVASEFLVHTKHTCDACFRQPILGQRYASGGGSNFDLCARCFDAYSGPDIGLTEAALVRDKKHSRDFVLKLKIDNGGNVQVRRVNVSEIWDKSISQLSFANLMSIAFGHARPQDKSGDALEAFIAKTKATYLDGDGDTITMTSDTELEDAFLQVLKKFPVCKPFRIKVTVPRGYTSKVGVTHRFYSAPAQEVLMTRRSQLRKIAPHEGAGTSPATAEGRPNAPPGVTPETFERDFFVHARHTCDGCAKSPIVGTRHRATKIPDFDLCTACFEKYEGEDLDFQPAVDDRDRRMQQRWLKRQLKKPSEMGSDVAGLWNQSNGDIFDFLKKIQGSGDSTGFAVKGASDQNSGKFHVHISPPCCGFSRSSKAEQESAGSPSATKPEAPAVGEAAASPKAEEESAEIFLATKHEAPIVEEVPGSSKEEQGSPAASPDESFLSDADGSGSIAEAIGRTLDVCVKEIEKAIVGVVKEMDNVGVASSCSDEDMFLKSCEEEAVTGAADAFSIPSSVVSNMTEVLKKMDDAKKEADASHDDTMQLKSNGSVLNDANDAASTGVPSLVAGATVFKSNDGNEKTTSLEMPKVEDVSDGEDWSVVSDGKVQVDHDEDIVRAENEADASVSSNEPLSPVVLAKWDTELFQLHELGFLDDRKNMDVMEHLEASHIGVDSTEKVTVQNIVEHLLGSLA